MTDADDKATVFLCGPRKCEHDYTGWREYQLPSGAWVGTAVCAKCGAEAYEEAAWN
jgi:hypothetical protein